MTQTLHDLRKDVVGHLKILGLSEREADIYICLTERLETTPYIISQALSIPRTTVYQTLETLRAQGLVLTSKKNGVKYYSPESFHRLKELVETKKRALQMVLPQLQLLSSSARLHEPTSHVYLGIEATKQVWEDMLESYRSRKTTQSYVTSSVRIYEAYGQYFTDWLNRRKSISRLMTYLIFPESERNSASLTGPFEGERFRFLPDEYLYPGEITVYGDKTAIFFFGGEQSYAIVLHSPEIADIFTRTLKLLWTAAQE